MIMGSFKSYLTLLHKFSKACLHPLKALKKVDRAGKKRNSAKRQFSGFNWLNSSFAAMEVSNQLRQVFNFIDANGDGKISTVELSEVLLCLGHEKSTAAKEAEGIVREVDYNGDGFIDLDEFMNIVSISDDAGKMGSSSSRCNEQEDYLMDAFLIFDTDKNGLISAKELQKVLTNLGFENCSLQDCGKMIKGVDMDGDGYVNFDEFRSMMFGSAN